VRRLEPGAPAARIVNFKAPVSLNAAMRAAADQRGVSISYLIRQAVATHLSSAPTSNNGARVEH
jgi:hypothetical protein